MVKEHYYVDIHIEVPPELTLGQAHERVSQLEESLRAEMPQVVDIHSHIEPLAQPAIPVGPISPEQEAALKTRIASIVRKIPGVNECHHLHIRPSPSGFDIAFHCLADAEMNIAAAHLLSDQVEGELRRQIPTISRVLVHLEPQDEDKKDQVQPEEKLRATEN